MKIRGITYITLLAIAIIAKIYLMLRLPYDEIFDWLGYSGLLFDIVFFGILVSLLGRLQERRWLSALAILALVACIGKDLLPLIADNFVSIPKDQFPLYIDMLTMPALVITIGLFFARRGPAQYCFRWLAVVMLIAYLVHLPQVAAHLYPLNVRLVTWLSVFALQYTILMNIVFKTPALTSAYGIDFP